MGIFSDFGDLGTLGLTAYGGPVAGVVGGALIGKLASQELQEEQKKQRAREMAAKASIIGTQWAPRAVSPDVVSVTPWKGDQATSAAGVSSGVGQALEYAKALKSDKSGSKDLFGNASKGMASNEAAPQEDFSAPPQRNVASEEMPAEGLQTLFGVLAKGRRGQYPTNY